MTLPVLLIGSSVDTTWEKYTSQEGGFSILMPGTPGEKIQKVDMKIGEKYVKINMYMFLLQRPGFSYMVVYNDMPQWNPEDVDFILDSGRDRGIVSLKGKLLKEKDIWIDGHPGREIKIVGADGFIYFSRMYLVKYRFYQVSVTTLGEDASSPNVARFLNSFKLITPEEVEE